ncbi:hypothetical protein DFP83_101325 [Idiomarina fontislapidosi]|uniref:Uncharacterized protein n=1 Tax=Idiomarina fontislapidosi TaxID=263723 RepID=A0A432YBM7_9GAMM|nr:hypothetical protein [Idiomarina fontislapidosi]PYE35438.1 hypothetical protein DFP83_101325 [Idiomarina fontislapidosi]RUO58321.1 hypothetical protein CWE25_01640 [Idiomarina fontislapidosi]|tara:strand:+ start:291 stop:1676 length:1386 start_codon:yes stop_codon:yes gene_type:complete
MNRLDEFLSVFRPTLNHPTAVDLYAHCKRLEYELSEYRWPDYFIPWSLTHRVQKMTYSLALQSAINVFLLTYKLGLATSFRRLLMTSAMIRALPTPLKNANKLKSPLLQVCLSDTVSVHHYAYYLVDWSLKLARYQLGLDGKGSLSNLLTGKSHPYYWPLAEALPPHKPDRMAGDALQRAIEQKQPQPLYKRDALKPPKTLLKAIKRYANSSGALGPIIHAIEQQPALNEALLAAASEHTRTAPFKSAKHAYLYLGAQRASHILASASLQQHIDSHRVPLHESLMQRLSLLVELWFQLKQQTNVVWPLREKLVAQIIAIDLIHHPVLANAIEWPQPQHDTPLSAFGLLGVTPEPAQQKHSATLIQRWGLSEHVNQLVSFHTEITNKQQAVFLLGCILLQRLFGKGVHLPKRWSGLQSKLMQQLGLSPEQSSRIEINAITQCRSYCPLGVNISVVNDYNQSG